MATEVPQYSDSIYKRLRGLRRDIPNYTEDDYKKSVPISTRVCTGIKVHYSNIPVDCYCPKYGYFEQKVIVGRTLVFFDKETLTFTRSKQRNAFNDFWDVSEKSYIPFADRMKEKEAHMSEVARSHSTRLAHEASRPDEHNLKLENEADQNGVIQSYSACCARTTDLIKHIRLSMRSEEEIVGDNSIHGKPQVPFSIYIRTAGLPFWLPTGDAYFEKTGNVSEVNGVIQPYSTCCERSTDLIKHMQSTMSNREEIVCHNIFREKLEVSISSYIVTVDLRFWLPTIDIPVYAEKTGNESEINRVIQSYGSCCARSTDLIKHMRSTMSHREEIVGDNIHVEKAEDDTKRSLKTATFQNDDFENAYTKNEPPKYGHENGILDIDATVENNCQLEDSAVNSDKSEQDYNTDFVTGILGIYARGQEHYNIENILTNTDDDDEDDDEDVNDFMSGLFGVYSLKYECCNAY